MDTCIVAGKNVTPDQETSLVIGLPIILQGPLKMKRGICFGNQVESYRFKADFFLKLRINFEFQ